MRGKKAKRLRKMAYGEEFSPKFRKYTTDSKGTVHADPRRIVYQHLKKGASR